jgi:hypothetical protein
MGAKALLDTRAKDLQALTLGLSPPARPRDFVLSDPRGTTRVRIADSIGE